MIINKGQAGTILIIAIIVILLSLSAYFAIKGLSPSTGKVVADNGANNEIISRITTPGRAVSSSPTLTSDNPTETSTTGSSVTDKPA